MVIALFSLSRQADRFALTSAMVLLLGCFHFVWAQESPEPAAPPAKPAPVAQVVVQPASPAALAIRDLLKAGTVPQLRFGQFPDYQAQLEALYQPTGYAPLWTQNGKPIAQAQKVIANIATADDKGLNSEDYDVESLRKGLEKITSQTAVSQQDIASFDVALSFSLMRYASNVYMGRINPKRVNFNLDIEPKKMDLPALLRKIVSSDNPESLLTELEPKLKLYEYLKKALARYRQLALDNPTAISINLPKKFNPGDHHADVPKIRKLMFVLGDMTEGDPNDPSQAYDKVLVDAVKRFQIRHGLAADGVIGKGTQVQFNVPINERLKQIQLGLERIRWLPSQIDGRYIIVNVPSFQLFGFHNGSGADRPDLEMNVIVGEAIDGRNTPVFHSDMTYVNFRPYWNVPPSIAVKEYVSILSRSPGYLAKHEMELVSSNGAAHGGGKGLAQQLASGALRLRQKPGPKNALGLVKFAFPNTNNVYLHSTPSQGLFKRTRRDFSHGCIRVEYPVTLAEFVLKDYPEWTHDKIVDAMQGTQSRTVTVKPAIPVYIYYSTVFADTDGRAMFYHDLYGHDAILSAELAKGFPYPQ
jgi:murein L,D-transpeptidase YcbB/YkuD